MANIPRKGGNKEKRALSFFVSILLFSDSLKYCLCFVLFHFGRFAASSLKAQFVCKGWQCRNETHKYLLKADESFYEYLHQCMHEIEDTQNNASFCHLLRLRANCACILQNFPTILLDFNGLCIFVLAT